MKILLILSLLINFVLSFILLMRSPEVIERERLVIESHSRKLNQEVRPVTMKESAPGTEEIDSKRKEVPELVALNQEEFQEGAEKVEDARREFLSEVLGMSDSKITQHNKLRQEFYKRSSEFWKKNPKRELSFQERRQLIDFEEDLHIRLEKLFGKKNWKKYQRFREEYNTKGLKRQMEEGQPFLFMGF
jgi:hypothetical protein